MKFSKRLFSLFLALVICFSTLMACGDNQEQGGDLKFTIKFNSNTDIEVPDLEYYVNEYTAFPIPERPGYVLKGWYNNASCLGRTFWSLTSETDPDTEYWAKWEPREFKVNFKTNKLKDRVKSDIILPDSYYADPDKAPDGLIAPRFTVESETNILLPVGDSVRVASEHYTFGGWYNNAACEGTALTAITEVDANNINLWPKLVPVDYTLSFEALGGAAVEPITYNVEHNEALPSSSRELYTFDGWYLTRALSGNAITTPAADGIGGNRTVYAKWNAIKKNITYNLNGGEWIADTQYPEQFAVSEGINLPSPKRIEYDFTELKYIYYTFEGWCFNAELSGEPVFKIAPLVNTDVELFAKWTQVEYEILYNMDGGNFEGIKFAAGYNAGSTITLANPNKTGYVFDGWYTTSNFSTPRVTQIVPTDVNRKELYAKWIPATYAVSFNLNEGQIVNAASFFNNYTYGDTKALPVAADLSRPGYTFEAWYLESDFSGDPITKLNDSFVGDVVFYAKWKISVYTLIYSTGDGHLGNTPTRYSFTMLDADIPVLSLPPVSIYPFVFEGWYTGQNGTGDKVVGTAVPSGTTSNVTLFAYWRKTFTINYHVNGGVMPDTYATEYTYGAQGEMTRLPIPTKVGFEFGGWVENPNPTTDIPVSQRLGVLRGQERNDVGNIVDGSGMGGDKELYALWIPAWSGGTTTQQIYAAQTNLYGVSGPGYSGSALGAARIQTNFAAAAKADGGDGVNGAYVGWTHGTDTQFVVYEFTLDRAVSNATLTLGFGSEFADVATFNGNGNFQPGADGTDPNNNLSVIVNGVAINWGSLTLQGGQFGHTTVSGVTLAAGKNSIGIMVLVNSFPSGQAGGGGGPLINYCTIGASAAIDYRPFSY